MQAPSVTSFALPTLVIERLVRAALEEDLGAGDVTTAACVPKDSQCVAWGYAKSTLVFAGADVAKVTFALIDPALSFEMLVAEGSKITPKTRIFRAQGSARSLLMAERVALNFVQRMSGVATMTRRYVDALSPGAKTRITDTRKTTPGLRALERYAVRMGGGSNHRDNLGSAVLIKDNHIVAAGGVRNAIALARSLAPHTSKVECEVKTAAELDDALAEKADIIMLDNMDDAQVKASLAKIAGRAFVEVSGGITIERIASLSAMGVDAISVGALTHSAPAVDISLDFEDVPKT
jgi:nicotinate-nucleotide pyrophosphorylase (carboxylating)